MSPFVSRFLPASLPVSLLLVCGLLMSGVPLAAHAGPVNINTADAATLAKELSGVGNVKAAAIVDYRQKHGAFKTVDDLALVPGIGNKFVERNRPNLRIDKGAAAGTAAAGSAPAAGTAPRK